MPSIIRATTTNGLQVAPDNSGSLVLQTNGTTTALTIDTSQNTTLAGRLTTASSGIQFSDSSVQSSAASPFGLKNRIINGDMVIDQRNAGASITQTTGSLFPVDRFIISGSVGSKFTAQQNAGSVTPPVGFTNYLGITSSSAYSVTGNDAFQVYQVIEGFNVADLAWGTANAQACTLSFWVRSSLTGTFGGSIATTKTALWVLPFTYTISSANTWTFISVSITAPTSTGGTNNDNTAGAFVRFGLGSTGTAVGGTAGTWTNAGNYVQPSGTVSVVGTNGATFYITGVQLERNTTATPFEWIPYTTELQLCQRYYYRLGGSSTNEFVATGLAFNSTRFFTSTYLKASMRASPTSVEYSNLRIQNIGAAFTVTAVVLSGNQGKEIGATEMNVASGLIANGYYYADTSSTSGYLAFNAEL
jgi:hypothetical protein